MYVHGFLSLFLWLLVRLHPSAACRIFRHGIRIFAFLRLTVFCVATVDRPCYPFLLLIVRRREIRDSNQPKRVSWIAVQKDTSRLVYFACCSRRFSATPPLPRSHTHFRCAGWDCHGTIAAKPWAERLWPESESRLSLLVVNVWCFYSF